MDSEVRVEGQTLRFRDSRGRSGLGCVGVFREDQMRKGQQQGPINNRDHDSQLHVGEKHATRWEEAQPTGRALIRKARLAFLKIPIPTFGPGETCRGNEDAIGTHLRLVSSHIQR